MKICVFGCGYVGLVTGVCFASMGNHVHFVDVDETRVQSLNNGECPIHEPGLESRLQECLAAGRISFTTNAQAKVEAAEVIVIAVGTPSNPDGSAKLDYVMAVAKTIGQHINGYKVIVTKSTVPVGTAEKVLNAIKSETQQPFDVVSNPEFLKEGAAIQDCMKPDRIIIGTSSDRALKLMQLLYAPFNRNHDRIIHMDERSAELTKYAANAMLATKISFMNEMSQIADKVGADIEKIRVGIGSDPRIGYQFIYPGCGYGGSCFPKDVQALSHVAAEYDYQATILDAVHQVNEQQKQTLFARISNFYSGQLNGKTFAVWGLAFKPNTDDIREAPSITLIEALIEAGAKIQAYDPVAGGNIAEHFKDFVQQGVLTLCSTSHDCFKQANALVICTEWQIFRSPDFNLVLEQLLDKTIFDGRNLYDLEHLAGLGIQYFGIGRRNKLI